MFLLSARSHGVLLGLALALASPVPETRAATSLALEDAIRAAWSSHDGLAAADAEARAASRVAEASSAARAPTVTLSARALATDEPLMAFGLKLDEGRTAASDFDPAHLTRPGVVGGVGAGATLVQPLYAGGRIAAGARAAASQAQAARESAIRQRQEIALAVVDAYFRAQATAQAVPYSEEQLAHARETEHFMRTRNEQDLVLDSEVARATAFRAQTEAQLAAARDRAASARSALTILAGDFARDAELTTPLAGEVQAPAPSVGDTLDRPDLRAARARVHAAGEGVAIARAATRPEVFAQASVETLRSSLDQGREWFTVMLGARWQLGLPAFQEHRAAQERERAAAAALRFQERQARREVEDASRAIATADARLSAAREAVAASQSARDLRQARHRQGLMALVDVLDAEAALAAARALLLDTQVEVRLARARLRLAVGQTVEEVGS